MSLDRSLVYCTLILASCTAPLTPQTTPGQGSSTSQMEDTTSDGQTSAVATVGETTTTAVDTTAGSTMGSESGDETDTTGEPLGPRDHLVIIYTGHGFRPSVWNPTGGTEDFVLSPLLEPLEGLRDRMVIVQGLDNPGDGPNVVQGSFFMGVPSLLTGGHIQGVDSCYSKGATASIDYVLGQALGPNPLTLMRTGVRSQPAWNRDCQYQWALTFTGANTTIYPTENLADVYSWLEKSVDPSAPYMRTAAMYAQESLDPELDFREYARRQLLMAHIGLAQDVTSVATISLGSMWNDFTVEEPTITLHQMAHGVGTDEQYVDGHRFFAEEIADFAQRMADTPYGPDTLLDHTVIVWLSESGDPLFHDTLNIPVVLIGNASGRMRNGAYLQLDDAVQADLALTLAEIMGVPLPSFGDPALSAQVLDELLAQ